MKALRLAGHQASNIQECFGIVARQRDLSVQSRVDHGFLDIFIIGESLECLAKSFCDPVFVHVVSEIGSLSEDSVIQLPLRLVDGIQFFDSESLFLDALTMFVSRFATREVFARLLTLKSELVLEFCRRCFSPSDGRPNQCFVQAGGVPWLFDVAKTTSDVDSVGFVLAALVSRTGFDEVDQAFTMADPSHPFFSLSESALQAIAYGAQVEAFPRIRVPFLFNKIALPEWLDPYNAYLMGKNCSESLLMRVMDTRLIGQIANRFVRPDHGLIILQNHSHLAECADPSVDHFPIFQLYPGMGD
jgi:hypothetical protein